MIIEPTGGPVPTNRRLSETHQRDEVVPAPRRLTRARGLVAGRVRAGAGYVCVHMATIAAVDVCPASLPSARPTRVPDRPFAGRRSAPAGSLWVCTEMFWECRKGVEPRTHPRGVCAGSTPLLGMVVRRRPTLPPRLQGSTIGAVGLSFRVRNGTGRFPHAKTTVTLSRRQNPVTITQNQPSKRVAR